MRQRIFPEAGHVAHSPSCSAACASGRSIKSIAILTHQSKSSPSPSPSPSPGLSPHLTTEETSSSSSSHKAQQLHLPSACLSLPICDCYHGQEGRRRPRRGQGRRCQAHGLRAHRVHALPLQRLRPQDPRRRQGPHPPPRHRGAGPVGAVDQGRAAGGVRRGPREAPPPPAQGHRQERRPRHPQAAAGRRQEAGRCRQGDRCRHGGAAPPQPAAAAGAARRRRLGRAPAARGLRLRCRGGSGVPVGPAGATAGGLPVLPPLLGGGGHRRRLGRVRVPLGGTWSLRRRMARPWRLLIEAEQLSPRRESAEMNRLSC